MKYKIYRKEYGENWKNSVISAKNLSDYLTDAGVRSLVYGPDENKVMGYNDTLEIKAFISNIIQSRKVFKAKIKTCDNSSKSQLEAKKILKLLVDFEPKRL